jgi:hypothetical protein
MIKLNEIQDRRKRGFLAETSFSWKENPIFIGI